MRIDPVIRTGVGCGRPNGEIVKQHLRRRAIRRVVDLGNDHLVAVYNAQGDDLWVVGCEHQHAFNTAVIARQQLFGGGAGQIEQQALRVLHKLPFLPFKLLMDRIGGVSGRAENEDQRGEPGELNREMAWHCMLVEQTKEPPKHACRQCFGA